MLWPDTVSGACNLVDDYDSPWKEAIERFFADFMAFYFPEAHAQIDWTQPLVFLDQELRAAVRDAELGKRVVDKLVRVTRRGGGEARLEDSRNPFALLTHAHLATRATRNDPAARMAAKWSLVKRLYQLGFERRQIIDLFNMIDWMMRLPKELEQQFWFDLDRFEEEMKMRYVNSVERMALERGMEQGMQQGLRAGKLQVVTRQLVARFGELPASAKARLDAATDDELDAWTQALLSAPSIDAVFCAYRH